MSKTSSDLEQKIAGLSAHDQREIRAFQRFLTEVGGPVKGKGKGAIWREHPGWIPYVLGGFYYGGQDRSLHPPEGFGHVPMTAWSFPA